MFKILSFICLLIYFSGLSVAYIVCNHYARLESHSILRKVHVFPSATKKKKEKEEEKESCMVLAFQLQCL